MNILEVQNALKNLDDDALKSEMLSPGVAPQFLVLSEMQRRQEIRKGGKAPPAGPRPSMKDEALAGGGIGSLPEAQGMPPGGPPQGMPAGTPPGMAPGMQPAPPETPAGQSGTPQAFAAGGPVVMNGQVYYPEDYDQDPNGALRAYRPPPDWTFGATPPRVRQPAPAGAPIPAGSLAPQGLGEGSPMYFQPQALAEDNPRLRIGPVGGPSITPEQADYPAATSTRPATAGLPAIAAARGDPLPNLPRYPATRTAMLLESGLGANTEHAGQTIRGPLGISDGMWRDYAGRLGLKASDRESPEAQRMIYESFSDDQRRANPRATDADVYTAWAAGPAAARAFRANPQGDAFSTYAGVSNPRQADDAFNNNPGLLRRGATNADVLANYRGRWDRAAESDVDGTTLASRNVAPPGSGAAAVSGDSSRPTAVQRPDSTGGNTQGGRFQDSYRDAAALVPDRLAGFEEEARTMFGKDASEARSQAGAFALMEAGLKMAGSRDTRLAGGIAEGGLAGLQSYRAGLAEAKKAEREGFQARLGLASARGQQDQGVLKTAAELYGTDSRERQSAATNATSLRVAGIGADASLTAAGIQADTSRANNAQTTGAQLAIADLQRATSLRLSENQMASLQKQLENPAALTTLNAILAMPPGPDRDAALKTITPGSYGGQTAEIQERAQAFNAYQAIEDNYKPDPLDTPAKAREKAAARQARIDELRRAYPRVFPPGAALPAAGGAPAAAADPLGLRGGR